MSLHFARRTSEMYSSQRISCDCAQIAAGTRYTLISQYGWLHECHAATLKMVKVDEHC